MNARIENTSSAPSMEAWVSQGPLPHRGIAAEAGSRANRGWLWGESGLTPVRTPVVAESLCAALALPREAEVLDVGLTGASIGLSAGRRGNRVVCFSGSGRSAHAEAQRERARECAAKERLHVDFERGDAAALPFADGAFDAVASSFSAMFAEDGPRVSEEMLRVLRPGGKIGLTGWTPEGFVGQLLATIAEHARADGIERALSWGTAEGLETLFGSAAETIEIGHRTFVMRYDSAVHWLNTWRSVYAPLQRALGGLDSVSRATLETDLLALVERCNTATDGTLAIPADYLEVVITTRDLEHRSYVN